MSGEVRASFHRLVIVNHQAIYLRYRSFKLGGVSELSYAQSDRSQATKLLTQAEDRDRDRFKSGFKEHPVPKVRDPTHI